MGGCDHDVTLSTLDGVSRRLAAAGADLDGGPVPDAAPDAGASTGAIAQALGALCAAVGDVVDGLHGASGAVGECRRDYSDADADGARTIDTTVRPLVPIERLAP